MPSSLKTSAGHRSAESEEEGRHEIPEMVTICCSLVFGNQFRKAGTGFRKAVAPDETLTQRDMSDALDQLHRYTTVGTGSDWGTAEFPLNLSGMPREASNMFGVSQSRELASDHLIVSPLSTPIMQ